MVPSACFAELEKERGRECDYQMPVGKQRDGCQKQGQESPKVLMIEWASTHFTILLHNSRINFCLRFVVKWFAAHGILVHLYIATFILSCAALCFAHGKCSINALLHLKALSKINSLVNYISSIFSSYWEQEEHLCIIWDSYWDPITHQINLFELSFIILKSKGVFISRGINLTSDFNIYLFFVMLKIYCFNKHIHFAA